jgi:dihydroxyacetone kinase
MRDAAMMLKSLDRSAQTPQGVNVRKLGGHDHGERGIRRSPIQSGSRKASAGKKMRYRLHGR